MTNIILDLRTARIIRNLSQAEVAQKCGVHVHTYRKWEKNPDSLEVGQAKKIAEILNLDYNLIFFNSNSTLSR